MRAAVVQDRLDKQVGRMDAELGRAASEYDEARDATAQHHVQTGKQVEALRKQLEPVAEKLTAVMEGREPAGPDHQKLVRKYQDLSQRIGEARTAQRLTFGATRPPGEVPTGKPLGTPSLNPVDTDSDATAAL